MTLDLTLESWEAAILWKHEKKIEKSLLKDKYEIKFKAGSEKDR